MSGGYNSSGGFINTDAMDNSHKNVSDKDLMKSCRICLLQGKDHEKESSQFVQPCDCSGSMKYSHFNCLKEWFELKIQKEGISDNTIKCQICHQKIQFQSYERWKCNGKDEIKKQIVEHPYLFIFNTLTFLILIILCIILGVLYTKNAVDQETKREEETFTISIVIFVVSVLLVAVLTKNILQLFLLKKRTQITKIMKYEKQEAK